MALRDARLIRALAAGQSIEELAAREDIPLRRARERVSAILSRRPDPPAEFASLQMRRLSEAMIVATAAMSEGNLTAVDRVLKITREFDRYAGLAQSARRGRAVSAARARRAPAPLALAPPGARGPAGRRDGRRRSWRPAERAERPPLGRRLRREHIYTNVTGAVGEADAKRGRKPLK